MNTATGIHNSNNANASNHSNHSNNHGEELGNSTVHSTGSSDANGKNTNSTSAINAAANITMLNNYFRLFDASRTDKRAMEDLLSLFTPDAEIVLNGNSRRGFEGFMKAFYEYNQDVKHMWDAWVLQSDGSYQANWAVCGQAADGSVYAKAGVDIARVNDAGQIVYLENVQADENAFSKYNS